MYILENTVVPFKHTVCLKRMLHTLYLGWNKLERVFLEISYNPEIWPAGGAVVYNYTLKNLWPLVTFLVSFRQFYD